MNTWRVSVWRLRQTRSRASEYSMHAVERDLGNPSASPGPSLGHSWSAIHLSGIPRSRRPHRCAFVSSTNWFSFQLIGYPKYDVARNVKSQAGQFSLGGLSQRRHSGSLPLLNLQDDCR